MSDAQRRPPAPFAMPPLTRRSVLATGAAGLAAVYGLAGCGDDEDSGPAAGAAAVAAKASGTVSFGSNSSDPVPKKALQTVFAAFTTAVEREGRRQHGRPQHLPGADQQLPPGHARRRVHAGSPATACSSSPSAGSPATSPTSGRRSAATISDALQEGLDRPRRQAVLRAVLLLPVGGLLPQERLREERLRAVPTTLDDFKALATKMKADGLTPIAFADKDGWPAMGTFDFLNMRINGYDFHVSLMAGEEAWEDPKVKAGLRDLGASCCRSTSEGALGRTWQEAAQSVSTRSPAMYLLGMFVGQQFDGRGARGPRLLPVPRDQLRASAQDALEAPIDGFMMSKEPEERGRRQGAARVPRRRRGAEHLPQDATRTTSPPTTRPTRAATTRCRRRRSS